MDEPTPSERDIAIFEGAAGGQLRAFACPLSLSVSLCRFTSTSYLHVHNTEIPLASICLAFEFTWNGIPDTTISVRPARGIMKVGVGWCEEAEPRRGDSCSHGIAA